MRNLLTIVAITFLASTAFTAAHGGHDHGYDHHETDHTISAGFIQPNSVLYGMAVATDNVLMRIGLRSPGEIVEKRAAQAELMIELDNPEAAARAAQHMEQTAERAQHPEDEQRIERAMQSMQETMQQMEQRIEDAPNEQAKENMQTALDSMQDVLDNMEKARHHQETMHRES